MDLCQYCIAIIAGNRPSQGVNTCPVRALTPVQALTSVNAWIEKINALTGLQYLIRNIKKWLMPNNISVRKYNY